VDRDPQDDIETVAAQVPVPGPSLVSAATRVSPISLPLRHVNHTLEL
jgi:hypothetical protein